MTLANTSNPSENMSNENGIKREGAWTVSSEAASEYLRARIPYQQMLIDTIFAYHEYSSSSNKKPKWDACLDLGCGPGQLGIHMSKRFKKIYGRDISEHMIDIAKTLPNMEEEELQKVKLFKPKADRLFDFCVANADELKMPDNSVDLIVIGSAVHWFDWSSPESSKRIWKEWSRVLRKDGSVLIVGGLPVAGNWTGAEAEKTRPLRRLVRFGCFVEEIAHYWTPLQVKIGVASFNGDLEMPWDLDSSALEQWDRSSKLFLVFNNPTDVEWEGVKKAESDPFPQWMPSNIVKSVKANAIFDELEERWKTTTARKMANWFRSASGYVHYLRDHPDEKQRVGRDDDLAARLYKQACQEGGLGYDETIEMPYTSSILALRRTA